ncbi:MAG: SGNH/GDSL hydrolase family protein [Xanthobacteraceae bacterium]
MSDSVRDTAPARRHSGLWSKLAFAAYLVVAVAVLLELALRGYFALQIGPRVLVYGTPWYQNDFAEHRMKQLTEQYDREAVVWTDNENKLDMVSKHKNAKGGYRKFFPNETKFFKDIDTGEVVPVTINRHGFRGKDFSIEKPDGVIRVLTLGASSTFGFYSRDDETYPMLLEQRLNARCHGSKRFEVINFAIPHARADDIRSMFVAEGIALDPDIITFYEGRNDSYRIHPMDFRQAAEGAQTSAGWLHRAWQEMTYTFVLARFVDGLVQSGRKFSAEEALESLRNLSARTSRAFIADVEEIQKLAEQRSILFIVANQQANSKSWFGIPQHERQRMRGVTYNDEVAAIERILERGEPISGYEFNFLIHARLMRDLEAWTHDKKLPFVDIIGLLDQERHHLVSWVHLDAYANGLIADALADEIIRLRCSRQAERDSHK